MKIVLITSPKRVSQEIETIERLLDEGLDYVHIRKPKWSDEELENYVYPVSNKYHKKIALHRSISLATKMHLGGIHQKSTASYHDIPKSWKGRKSRSTHSIDEIEKFGDVYDYYFLSPVFDSISKKGYESNFNKKELKQFLTKHRKFEVYALGGVESTNIHQCQKLGFDGFALLGTIWRFEKMEDRLKEFEKIALAAKGVGEF